MMTSGCSVVPALIGAGADLVASQLNDAATRTFDHPVEVLTGAVVAALGDLGMHIDSVDRSGPRHAIRAGSEHRSVRVELEPVSAEATWVSIMARDGLDVDEATARWVLRRSHEIVGDGS